MDSHAQLEIRQYANAMADIVKQLYPVAYKAFEDYQLNAVTFSAMEMEVIDKCIGNIGENDKSARMTKREWNEFKAKLGV
jgi:thymidylate synthase (FAD)